METTKLTSKGQLVIPKRIRDALRAEPGTRFSVSLRGSAILLESNVDFADALHIASSGDREFVTLDSTLVRRVSKAGGKARLLRRAS